MFLDARVVNVRNRSCSRTPSSTDSSNNNTFEVPVDAEKLLEFYTALDDERLSNYVVGSLRCDVGAVAVDVARRGGH